MIGHLDKIGHLDSDRLSQLPDSLAIKVLSYLPTKEAVKTSLLSRRWSSLWKCVPRLNLEYGDFRDHEAVVSFVNSFLAFETESKLEEFSLKSESVALKEDGVWGKLDDAYIPHWINTAILERKLEHLKVLERRYPSQKNLEIPSTVYTCGTLVTMELRDVILPDPSSVSLPLVKTIRLEELAYANSRSFEMLISGCPVLESLYVKRCPYENAIVFRVSSQTLRSFTLVGHCYYDSERQIRTEVEIDAPKLEYLKLFEDQTRVSIRNNLGSLVKVDLDTRFHLPYESGMWLDPNDVPKKKIIRDFLMCISHVRDMVISSDTLEIIYDFSRCEQRPIPLFRNLYTLRANFLNNRWEVLPVFLQSCPNLKSLSLSFSEYRWVEIKGISPRPYSVLPTLEHVKIVQAMKGDVVAFTKLTSYFLEMSSNLKEFTFCLDDFSEEEEGLIVILTKLLAIPRLCSSCEVVAHRCSNSFCQFTDKFFSEDLVDIPSPLFV